jgi:hypothetical protein
MRRGREPRENQYRITLGMIQRAPGFIGDLAANDFVTAMKAVRRGQRCLVDHAQGSGSLPSGRSANNAVER